MIAALAVLMLAQSQGDVSKDYYEINSLYARACSQGAVAAGKGAVEAKALDACSKALASEPLNALGLAQTLTNRGVIRFAANDQAGALRDFSDAIARQPDYALAYADRSIQLDNTNARAWLMRGGANEMLGRTAEAYKDYQTAARLDPAWERPKAELSRFRVGR